LKLVQSQLFDALMASLLYLFPATQEEHAAEAYDVAVLKVKGGGRGPIKTNFDPR
jgi:hypothetical protein